MKNAIVEQVGEFKRIIMFSMPFDKRHSDPKKNCGIHGMNNAYILVKDQKAVQFVLYLPVHLDHVAAELFKNNRLGSYNPFEVMAAEVGYHSPTPMYDDQSSMSECKIIECECYCDGSVQYAKEVWKECMG